ncbi:DUF2680 domain-containing protein [Serpentinicella alkaliphila]|uniref:Uncharacterized protein DUF2680 n=1 Tax=Serpentinicella alkaliphila TaxID=1734049 RepID=A0A4V2T251_9FIRM|nr:DUF2680 domain-containing protein [Serpentinicella alkaliphila]QUH25832.1 DUF2680 domain-containing protein [Serpentinicella alkaliphila]TCP96053.1 uncharacterized protein DUF2680 [Serpentinicella alkaliphila]
MNLNKGFVGFMVALLMTTVGVTAVFAGSSNSSSESSVSNVRSRIEKRKPAELTDEQREAMELRRSKMVVAQEKWATLTDEQKEEIYLLKDEITKIEGRIIDKYSEWKVIDGEMASQIKERLEESRVKVREANRMPMLGRRGGLGRGFKCNEAPQE